jgi:hypothetical protein
MEELACRRAEGDTFNYEQYIADEVEKVKVTMNSVDNFSSVLSTVKSISKMSGGIKR